MAGGLEIGERMICNKCWGDAYLRARLTHRSQADCYIEILAEREDNPCSIEQQGCRECGHDELVGINKGDKMVIECCNCGELHEKQDT